MRKRPKPKKEIKITNKEKEKEHVLITNIYNKSIQIQLKAAPTNDPLLGEQTIHLKKMEHAVFPKDRLYFESQVRNLQKKGFITVKPYKEPSKEEV